MRRGYDTKGSAFYTGAVRGLSRAPYRDQVIAHMINRSISIELSASEEVKIARCSRFLPASQCADEIAAARPTE